MKKYIIMMAAALLGLVSCSRNDAAVEGSWQLESSPVALEEGYDVYVSFEGGSFELYQKMGSERYYSYKGSYTCADGVVVGRYSDGAAWASSYKVSRKDAKLILTAVESGSEYVYRQAEIPEEVKENSVPVTKASFCF